MNSSALIYIILFVTLAYYTYMSLVKKNGLGKEASKKYTKESIEKYSMASGIGLAVAAIMCLVIVLLELGIIPGYNSDKHFVPMIVLRFSMIAVIIIPALAARKVLVKTDASSAGAGNGSKEEEEDF